MDRAVRLIGNNQRFIATNAFGIHDGSIQWRTEDLLMALDYGIVGVLAKRSLRGALVLVVTLSFADLKRYPFAMFMRAVIHLCELVK